MQSVLHIRLVPVGKLCHGGKNSSGAVGGARKALVTFLSFNVCIYAWFIF